MSGASRLPIILIKPKLRARDVNGNVFEILATCVKLLRHMNAGEYATELRNRILGVNREPGEAKTYEGALRIMREYVDILGDEFNPGGR